MAVVYNYSLVSRNLAYGVLSFLEKSVLCPEERWPGWRLPGISVGIFTPVGTRRLAGLHRDCENLALKALLFALTPFVLGDAYLLTFQ